MQTATVKGLFRRYVTTLAGLVCASVLTVGAILACYHFFQDRRRAEQLQMADARAASASIDAYLRGIEGVLRPLSLRSDEGRIASRDVQAADFRNALRFQPAILNIRSVDASFRETNFVSRIDPDRVESLHPQPTVQALLQHCRAEFCYGAAFVRDQTEPYVSVVAGGGRGGEAVAAEISVKFIDDLLSGLAIGKSGRAYIVDKDGRLLAHPDLGTLLRKRDVSYLPQVQKILLAARAGRPGWSAWGESPEGGTVFSTATQIAGPSWLLFVEQSAEEVLSTVKATIGVTVLVLALGVAAASFVSLMFARRLTNPILLLRDGAEKLGSGDLTARIEIRTRDEIESVAAAFNSMADSLRSLYDSLEAKVEARTRDLAQANEHISAQARELSVLNQRLGVQLQEINLKREAADRNSAAKTRFVAAASHDLRQPMHAVGLLVGILADRRISPETSALLTKIQLSVAALENLFGSLLDISRLDAGIVAPNLSCIGMDSLLKSVELAHAQAAAEKGLTLRIAESRTKIFSDSALLLSILGNILANAIRYTERGRIDIYCRKERRDLVVYVCDTGIGIPDDQLGRVFDEYYQLSNSGQGRGQGLGLGLAIVSRTAELLGHALIVRSLEGVGSVFGIRIPIAARDQITQVSRGAATIEDWWLIGAFVVVVDDDAEGRFATEAIFKSWGCHVISGDGREAVRRELTQHLRQPDLIVADYWLESGETGLSIIADLRRDAEICIPAIILTADSHRALMAAEGTQGVAIIQKPANAQRIRQTVAELLRAEEAPNHATSPE